MRGYPDSHLKDIESIWDLDWLKKYLANADEDIKIIQNFIKKYTEQAQKILLVENKKTIELNRVSYNNEVIYRVTILNVIYYENKEVQKKIEKLVEFKGKERIEAINYTKELIKKYNYPIVITGKWSDRTKPKNLGV